MRVGNVNELRFRVWDSNRKKMDYDGYVLHPNGQLMTFPSDGFGSMVPLDDSYIVMQSLKYADKNKVDICDGDILRYTEKGQEPEIAQVYWIDGGFVLLFDGVEYQLHHNVDNLDNYKWSDIFEDEDIELEVIGNIYETPELVD